MVKSGYRKHIEFRNFSSQFMAVKKPAFTEETCHGPFVPAEGLTAESILKEMTEDEKLDFLSGTDSFCTKPIERLGVPSAVSADASSGIRTIDIEGTIMPSSVALAASFDRELAREYARTVARDGRRAGVSILLGPGINISRIPTCGRNFEYTGEDPYLAGEIAASYIRGCSDEGIATTVKHFACNNSDYDRNRENAVVPERALREIYLPAFRKAVKAGTKAIMMSYNLVNGEHSTESSHLLDILRNEWGFDGLAMSDWISTYDAEAIMHHGIDLEMPFAIALKKETLRRLLDENRITWDEADAKVFRILKCLERTGVFSRPVADYSLKRTEKDAETAYRTAAEAITLLKNENGTLPLKEKDGLRIVILGHNAVSMPTSGGGSCNILTDRHIKTLAESFVEAMPSSEVIVSDDDRWYMNDKLSEDVKNADLVIYATGYDSLLESEFYDRSYELPESEAEGIREAYSRNRKLAVAVNAGADYETESWIDYAPALINAYYLGEYGADALRDVITGRVNPSGKLPFTMARRMSDFMSTEHYPADYDEIDEIRQGMVIPENDDEHPVWDNIYSEGILVGYRQFDTKKQDVLFPFGHGLSYTEFSYSDLQISKKDDTVLVSFCVQNTGRDEGTETAQVYIHDCESSIKAYQELKGFERIVLQPGEKKKAEISIPESSFARFDEERNCWITDRHTYTIRIGSSSRDIRLEGSIRL